MKNIHSHISGFHYFFKGFHLLFKPGVKRYIIVPVIINCILSIIFLGATIHLTNYLIAFLPDWLQWLKWIIDPFIFLTGSVILVYLFTIITNLIGAPFNSFLSEKIERLHTGTTFREDDSILDSVKDLPRTVKREGTKILYYIPRALLFFVLWLILFFIPVLHWFGTILFFLFSAWMMAVEYLDYPMDNHKMTFKQSKIHLKAHRTASLSFGLAVAIAAMIPLLNFFVMPAAVSGATLMYLEQQRLKTKRK